MSGIQRNFTSTDIKKNATWSCKPQFENVKSPENRSNINKKNQCILLGTLKDRYKEVCNISVNNAVRCLSFFIWHSKEQWYNFNWFKIYEVMEKLSESWKKKINDFTKNLLWTPLAYQS